MRAYIYLLHIIFGLICKYHGATGQGCCPNGWTRLENFCYWLADEVTVTWSEAAHFCESHHSELVKIDSAEEDMFVKHECQRLFRATNPTYHRMNNSFWTGGTDDVTEGEWVWYQDNSPLSYVNWHPGQPDSTGGVNQDCLLLYAGSGFHWHDHECSEPAHPLCEIDMEFQFGPGIVG